ncbi:pyruvate carboxylase [Akanthomyces lecanii RCEF 1005]|uniref:Pyruvate carboxylase n=1 Tax=Akanthomyces lecanii RCEF 1005 TaxID=1081108 RepID=A0A168FQ38_CORDF|nr:pyruvate carboxylase [Akanthomyces lecanii RCEF 1005]
MADAISEAKSEAGVAFGSDVVFVEKYLGRPQHIEVQVPSDGQGNHIHLHERDCSIQRKHQKIIEIAPAMGISEAVRQGVTDAAVRLAQGLKYEGAGTVEFLMEGENFYFIEMNPRIQVEHTITEELTRVDLVAAQLRIACGATLKELGLVQDKILPKGCSIQCRVTTEIPLDGFRPDTGTIDRTLREIDIQGIETNIDFLVRLLEHLTFLSGACWTSFVDDTPELFVVGGEVAPKQGVLRFLADAAVNGSRIRKPPALKKNIFIGELIDRTTGEQISTEDPRRDGWRSILLRDGPPEFARQVRAHQKTLITDTTWRDGQQSLLATRKDAYSLEAWGRATFDVMLRFLYEDPWQRLRKLRELVPYHCGRCTLLGSPAKLSRMQKHSVSDATKKYERVGILGNALFHFVSLAKQTCIDIFRVFDSLNDLENLKVGIEAIHAAGGLVEGAIMYTGDMLAPGTKYGLEYYMKIVDRLVEYDIHIISIKSMSGVMKPAAGHLIPLWHHVTASGQLRGCLTAEHAIESALELDHIAVIDAYWAQLRLMYAGFDADLRSPDPTVYKHEIPGGQYSKLMFQAQQNGLGGQWTETIQAYQDANLLLGDIIKATPTSKAVGDLAQFMVDRGLSATAIQQQASKLDLPQSVLEYFTGQMGQPFDGFPEPLRSDVLRGRPGNMAKQSRSAPASADLNSIRRHIASQFPGVPVIEHDAASYVMFPDVYIEFRHNRRNNLQLGAKNLATAKMLAILPPEPGTSKRSVLFRLDGEVCFVEVQDDKAMVARKREKARPDVNKEVASPMVGRIVGIKKNPGGAVEAGDVLIAVSAMKMEIHVSAPVRGRIASIAVAVGDMVEKEDLLARIE